MVQYVSVSSLNKYLKAKFAQDPHLRIIYLKGELSNVKRHSSGHCYFTIKDDTSRISAVMFATDYRSIGFQMQDGQQVLVEGSVGVFENAGSYQIYAKKITLDGFGSLFVLYEQLKQKMSALGWFDTRFKKAIPKYPKQIAIISAATGAALQDVLTTLKRRYPIADVTVFPCLVQGKQAGSQIATQIAKVDQYSFDVLILARGGGSIEDLWAFNEEIVAKAIYEANVVIVSAIGHETDFTIADFVSDLRAPTPTAAAELVTPNKIEILNYVHQLNQKMTTMMDYRLSYYNKSVQQLQNHYILKNPKQLVRQQQMSADHLSDKLYSMQRVFVYQSKEYISSLVKQSGVLLQNRLGQQRLSVIQAEYLNYLVAQQMTKQKQRLGQQLQSLTHLNPLEVLKRGYAVVMDNSEHVIASVESVQIEDNIRIKVSDGEIIACVKGVSHNE